MRVDIKCNNSLLQNQPFLAFFKSFRISSCFDLLLYLNFTCKCAHVCLLKNAAKNSLKVSLNNQLLASHITSMQVLCMTSLKAQFKIGYFLNCSNYQLRLDLFLFTIHSEHLLIKTKMIGSFDNQGFVSFQASL